MGSRLYRAAALPAALAAAGLIAACGGSSPSSSSSSSPAASPSPTAISAAQILPKMKAAVNAAQSVHMSGSATSGSQHVTFDVSFFGKSGVDGSVGVNGATFIVLSVAGKTYIKVNAAFLKAAGAPASACAKVCGKYVEVPAAQARQLTGSFTLGSLAKQAFAKLPGKVSSASVMFTPATVGGQQVLQFSQGGNTIAVAGTGTPYPLLIKDTSGDNIQFSQWNSVTTPSAPPASEIIQPGQL